MNYFRAYALAFLFLLVVTNPAPPGIQTDSVDTRIAWREDPDGYFDLDHQDFLSHK